MASSLSLYPADACALGNFYTGEARLPADLRYLIEEATTDITIVATTPAAVPVRPFSRPIRRSRGTACRYAGKGGRFHSFPYPPPTPSMILPVPPQLSHDRPSVLPLPPHTGQSPSPVPGVPSGASSPGRASPPPAPAPCCPCPISLPPKLDLKRIANAWTAPPPNEAP